MSDDSLEDRALALIKSRSGGVLQSELWKDLDIDSRKCSRIIAKLEEEGKIKRSWETVKGTRTYRISYLPQKKEAPKKAVDFGLIMAEGQVAPCIGCTYECEPDYCPDLGNWIDLLARSPISEAPAAVSKPAEAEVAEAPAEEAAEVPVSKKAIKAPGPAKREKPAKGAAARKATTISAKKAKPEAKASRTIPSKAEKTRKSGKK